MHCTLLCALCSRPPTHPRQYCNWRTLTKFVQPVLNFAAAMLRLQTWHVLLLCNPLPKCCNFKLGTVLGLLAKVVGPNLDIKQLTERRGSREVQRISKKSYGFVGFPKQGHSEATLTCPTIQSTRSAGQRQRYLG